jgi:hypothetical protein
LTSSSTATWPESLKLAGLLQQAMGTLCAPVICAMNSCRASADVDSQHAHTVEEPAVAAVVTAATTAAANRHVFGGVAAEEGDFHDPQPS